LLNSHTHLYRCRCVICIRSLFLLLCVSVFFSTDTPTTEIYTLSLHDALPISGLRPQRSRFVRAGRRSCRSVPPSRAGPSDCGKIDRKSTRLNSSHGSISYAVFCLKKKKTINTQIVDDDITTTHTNACKFRRTE